MWVGVACAIRSIFLFLVTRLDHKYLLRKFVLTIRVQKAWNILVRNRNLRMNIIQWCLPKISGLVEWRVNTHHSGLLVFIRMICLHVKDRIRKLTARLRLIARPFLCWRSPGFHRESRAPFISGMPTKSAVISRGRKRRGEILFWCACTSLCACAPQVFIRVQNSSKAVSRWFWQSIWSGSLSSWTGWRRIG